MTDHREQNSSCPVTWEDEPRGFLTEWEATPLKPTEDAKMGNDEAERPAYLICKYGGYYRPNCRGYTTSAIQAGRYTMAEAEKFTHPNGPDGPRDGMHYVREDDVTCADYKAYRAQAARIAELEASLQAVLRREEDANKAAFAHMRRAEAAEAEVARLREAQTQAATDVLAERQRQISAEGWTHEHDDDHDDGELAKAAGAYALASTFYHADPYAAVLTIWPWPRAWLKPTNPRRDLVKAGALILAEIERMDRAALQPKQEDV